MNGIRSIGRGIVVLLELVAALLAIVVVIGDGLVFYVSYRSPLGTYTGQEDDRVAALRLLWLAVPGILLMASLTVLEIRRARRRRRSRLPGVRSSTAE